jgi:glycosyltransferase involved in cell wall biosynthesis
VTARISIVVPVRDGERYLAAALGSLLGQERAPDEVIVVDDGSTDASAQVAASVPGVVVVRRAAEGPAAARNAGVARATGELIGFLDADDAATPRALLAQEAALALALPGGGADVAAGLARNVPDDGPGVPDASRARDAVRSYALGTLLVRRAALDRVGPLDPMLVGGEGVDWVARARRAGLRFAEHDEVVLLRRDHGANFSTSERARAGYLQLARAAILRRRDAVGTEEP